MAADRPLTERSIIEFKMGKSKFPGKPSKIGNRKRVNLSSCALPEDNDSSKAAKNIYLGLSVFNETFGDNEMVTPKPFNGFSFGEVEEAMAEARLQQKEAEVEYKKQGISINLWDCFQNELFSITSCLNYDKNAVTTKNYIKDAKLSFDGGGNNEKKEITSTSSQENNDNQASNLALNKGIIVKNKANKVSHCTIKRTLRTIGFPNINLNFSHHSPKTNKSLQSQAAKKLLEKAKMSNLPDSNKNLFLEKKFILPSHSIHSSRVIKPNKRFFEENLSKRKLSKNNGASEPVLSKKPKIIANSFNTKMSSDKAIDKSLTEELKIDVSYEDGKKKKLENSVNKNCLDSPQNNLTPNTGKGILREARLQLDKTSISLLEGPFSSPNASSLSPNSNVKVNLIQSAIASGSVVCGVCGFVRFYKFVELTKKFGIHCCEFCRKFISKIIKLSESEQELKLQCLKSNGSCLLNSVVKNQHFNINKAKNNIKCQACWLKLCVKNFKMPIKLKQRLLKLLPVNIQMSISLESSPLLTNEITNKFLLGNNNVKDFKWLYENSNSLEKFRDSNSEKQLNWINTPDSVTVSEKFLRKRTRTSGNENKTIFSTQNRKSKTELDEKNRQSVILKGPRVKHVCRSASVVLGQPLATFPNETSPTKKLTNDDEDCKNCDKLLSTNNSVESQGNKFKSNKELSELKQGNKEKKLNSGKDNYNPKISVIQQNIANSKPKKKPIVKTENPISMDFWESYDPEEVSETGFGLIGSDIFTVRALCFLCGSLGHEKLIHCASCCEPYHEFCIDEGQFKLQNDIWKYNWVCPRCTVCFTCGRTSGQQLKCVKCDNSYHIECVDRIGGRLLHSPDRPWVCSACLRCKSCNAVDVSIFVGNLPLCKACFILRQKGNFCPLCQRCYEDDDYDSKMMECGQCKCWVHAKCEGLSDEKYQVLSFLPESVEYVCRMCCIMPPAPWWLAVEAELKSGYLGVLKALSKNRKACTMLKWSPRKQCTCRQLNFVSKALDFNDKKISTNANESSRNESDNIKILSVNKKNSNKDAESKGKQEKVTPAGVTERKTSIEVINHPTESLKLTLKILKNTETEDKEATEIDVKEKNNIRVKKSPLNEENSEDSLTNLFECPEDTQTSLLSLFKSKISTEFQEKRSLSSPVIPSSDSGIGSTDDELKASCLTDEESCKLDEHCSNNKTVEVKLKCDNTVSFLEEKRECFCFLEVDSYNSRSKPFSPNLMSIKKKVTTSEYSSLHQFHQDMQRMIATTNSEDLMDLYHQTVKEIFPWFDPKYSRVQSNSQKLSETMSLEFTPVKSSPSKNFIKEECKIPKEKLSGQSLDYFYKDYVVEDTRYCLLCKMIGDGPPGDTGRLLYCGQNEWVHCNCALWSGEVFEEIDGSLQNVYSAISRGRSIKCPQCNLKGASIGCCARNCQETYHFSCARKFGCIFMDDKTLYCPSHAKESIGKLVQNEKDFEIRRPVYVELDKRKMKSADSSQIRFAVGALQVEKLGKFVMKLSDQKEAIIPEQFSCTRLFWSCYEPWRIVRYHFTVRLVEAREEEGIDFGINLTLDHSKEPELVEIKLKQLKYFQDHNLLLDISDEIFKEKRKLLEQKSLEGIGKFKPEENLKVSSVKRIKKDNKNKKFSDHFDSKFEENCLSDNQNTADLLPPDLEEAIFNDLPHDILDGISMQDIFMDIKNDAYENIQKEGIIEEASETDENTNSFPNKTKKTESLMSSQNEFWIEPNENRQDITEEIFTLSKNSKDIKLNKSDGLTNPVIKKANTLKTYQKSCNLNWNCKNEGNKWKKNSKCHVTVNLLDSQERGNMLQELKFTDGLVTISTGAIDSVQDLKSHLDDNKCSMQQEEGKENKCFQWHTRLQPRLLQVDGNVDSSSSGSEAGESPQRLMDENINSKTVPPPQISPYLDSPTYSLGSPEYKTTNYIPTTSNLSLSYSPSHSVFCNSSSDSLPQLDGLGEDNHSDYNDVEDEFVFLSKSFNKLRHNKKLNKINKDFGNLNFKINQCDGSVDSDVEDEDSLKFETINDKESPQTKEEPVKCNKCYCTYRTKMSYQRHLDTCCNDFILSSSEGELSEDESPKKQCSNNYLSIKKENNIAMTKPTLDECDSSKENLKILSLDKKNVNNTLSVETLQSPGKDILEVKKDKAVKRTYTRKKSASNAKKFPIETQKQVPQISVQQSNNNTPALIVQDVTPQNVIPTLHIESTPTVNFLQPIDSQNAFAKTQLITTPNGMMPSNIQFPPASQTQLIGGLCLTPQNINPTLSGFIIQQPQAPGTLISQPGPLVMSSEQVVVGSTGVFDVIQDPRTGGMFLTNHNQPIFYNTETIVSNTVMQTNQFVSNFLATTYSQTSTQIFQTSEVEPIVNVPSGYIIVGGNPPTANRIFSAEDLICLQTPQTIIPNQTSIQIPNQNIFNTSIQSTQSFNTEPKLMPPQINPYRCLQPIRVKPIFPSYVLNKVTNSTNSQTATPVIQRIRQQVPTPVVTQQSEQVKIKHTSTGKNSISNHPREVPMMRPDVPMTSKTRFEKAVITPKSTVQQVKPRTRALVDYINNFRSDFCDSAPESPVPNSCEIDKTIINSSVKYLENQSTISSNSPKSVKSSVYLSNAKTSSITEIVKSLNFCSENQCSQVQKLSKNVEPEKTLTALPNSTKMIKKSPISEPVSFSKTSVKSFLEVPVKQKNDFTNSALPNISKTDNLSVNSVNDISTSKNLEQNDPLKSVESKPLFEEKNEKNDKSDELSINVQSEISIVKADTFTCEGEIQPSLSMPELEDSFSCRHEEQLKKILSAPTPKEDEKLTTEILPLQENSQSINITKSPQKSSPNKHENIRLDFFQEKIKLKKKICFDQNSPNHKMLKSQEHTFSKNQEKKKIVLSKKFEDKGPKLIFDVTSDDGFKKSSSSMLELWANICDSVQEMRAVLKIPPLPISRKGHEILGMQNHGLQYCLEQLRGVEQCINYKCKYFDKEDAQEADEEEEKVIKENSSGCARTEEFLGRKEYDMFAWLASRHRQLPKLTESAEEILSSIRRANNLPIAMKYRNLKETAKLYVAVSRSKIHGRGLFCLREIEAGEMVIEYAGEVIRSTLTDKREKYYTDKGIGCYMFRIDDHFVVDATMKGNAARFINHSCEPNCYSRVVDILGKKHIVIFALRKINIMEELTYDYKFPLEDEKISCHCLSKKCRKYLN